MKVALFSTKSYDQCFFDAATAALDVGITYHEIKLTPSTARLAEGQDAVCVFVNDDVSQETIAELSRLGVRFIALRCAGFNNVDVGAAQAAGIPIVRVPAYSPHAVAEHTVALILSLNRHIHRAYTRVRDGNFALHGLLGFDLHGRTVGVVGTGKIGLEFSRLMKGFGCDVLAYDVAVNPECEEIGVRYVSLEELFSSSDIISLHCPLVPQTHHLIDESSIAKMKRGVMIVNTSRGAVIDTSAVIAGLKTGQIGYLALDVYEEEGDLFFEDLSDRVIADDTLSRLQTFPNVLITGHQAFFTSEAMSAIAEVTVQNLLDLEKTGSSVNEVKA